MSKKPRVKNTAWTPFVLCRPDERAKESVIFKNSKYTVFARTFWSEAFGKATTCIHLSIKRNDKQPVHDWRDLMRIKNELVGSRWEAVEVYPSVTRVVDTANQYHLWCFESVPIGFFDPTLVADRAVLEGAVQCPGVGSILGDLKVEMLDEDVLEKIQESGK